MITIKVKPECITEVAKVFKSFKIKHGPFRKTHSVGYTIDVFDDRCILLLFLTLPNAVVYEN